LRGGSDGRGYRRSGFGSARWFGLVAQHRSEHAIGYPLLAEINNFRGGKIVAAVAILDEGDRDIVIHLGARKL
jgi:hypothetical protein